MAAFQWLGKATALSAGLLLAGCGSGGASDDTAMGAPVTVVTASAPASAPVVVSPPVPTTPAPTPAPTPTPSPTTTATPASTPATGKVAESPVTRAALAPLDLTDMRLWNYAGKWHASEWANGMSPIGWKFDHVSQPSGTDTYLRLDAAGAPELQAEGGTPVSGRALWEAEVTLPRLKDGLIVAPLWLWDGNSRDEVDFEFAGRGGLDVTIHANVNGTMQQNSVRLFAGRDMSGERHRFGIQVDEAAGYVDMYVDGQRVHRWDRAATPVFVSHPLKPMVSMWAANPSDAGFTYWAGRWAGLQPGEALIMTVHGYGYQPLG